MAGAAQIVNHAMGAWRDNPGRESWLRGDSDDEQ
ncbi:hypothetical protein COLO4_37703 [Corchorus olitorius]|uniref:Uncharacterized protein n=1 Tax=Corchorus olitorius TaxID=93759 RepID=A0A1R3FZY0_9ROSI|nr:hypothetical protein COLO4_37703 [Corchorus olitorius]